MNAYIKLFFSGAVTVLLFPLRLFPVKRKTMIFTGLTGGGDTYEYSCNPMYLSKYIDSCLPGEFRIYWVVSNPGKYQGKEKNVVFLRHYTLRSFFYLLTCKVVVTNGSYAPWFRFRKRQYVINTWHGGGAYKKIENDKPDANYATRKRAEFCDKNVDLFLSSCTMATEKLIRGAFLYHGEVLEVGTPRNDHLVNQDVDGDTKTVREHYGIGFDEKILLYAPTYRQTDREISLDAEKLLQLLEKDGQRWCILFRPHRYQDRDTHIRAVGKQVIFAHDYPDMQQLLAAADILITDYSSCFWDYSFLYRPCFLYVPDLEEYRKGTGFYVEIEKWPFPQAKNWDELKYLIENYDEKQAKEQIDKHHQYMGSCETGNACRLTARKMIDICEEKK